MNTDCPSCKLELPELGPVFLIEGELYHVACGTAVSLGAVAGAGAEQGARNFASAAGSAIRDAVNRKKKKRAPR